MALSGRRRSRRQLSPACSLTPIRLLLVLLSGEAALCDAVLALPRLENGTSIQTLAACQSEGCSGRGKISSRRAQAEGAVVYVDAEGPKLGFGFAPPTSESDLVICSVVGGMDLTRYYSSVVRSALASAVADAEFLREYITESMGNDGIRRGMSNLTAMASTLNWEMRKETAENIPNWAQECHTVFGLVEDCEGWANLTAESTTLTAGLGWVDDRPDRRVERYVTLLREPFVGTKQTDMDFIDTASNILPWLVDRHSKEEWWRRDHQNGRSEGPNKDSLPYDRLYDAASVLSWGGALLAYPPVAHNVTIGDITGANFDLWSAFSITAPTGWPFEHQVPGGTVRDTILADGLHLTDDIQRYRNFSDLVAVSPIYFTGEWRGYNYNDTFLGVVSVGVKMDSLAYVYEELEDGLCVGSFALLVDANTFEVISISPSVLKKIYPERTGTDDKWPEDQKNQTFTVQDTKLQGLDGLVSANWTELQEAVQATPRGERDHIVMDFTVTGAAQPQEYYAMFDRWSSVSDYVMLVFAPVEQVRGALRPVLTPRALNIEIMQGEGAKAVSRLVNSGTMGFRVSSSDIGQMPEWLKLVDMHSWNEGIFLDPEESVDIEFSIETRNLRVGRISWNLALDFVEPVHQNCFYNETIVHRVSVYVTQEPDLNQLSRNVRISVLSLCTLALATAVAFAFWTWWFRKVRVVRASQPPFLIMICFGCFVLASTIIPFSIDDSVASQRGCDIACMASPWLGFMGNVITFAALFSKIWRINKIFSQARFRRITVKEKDVMIPFAVLFSSNFVFLLCWTLLDPLKWKREPTGEWSSRGWCQWKGNLGVVFLSLCLLTNFTAMILACIQAYRARGIDDEYSESKWIAISLGGMLQAWILGLPLLFLVWENPTALVFTGSALIFILSMSILLMIFVPKMIFMKNQKEAQTKKKADKFARADMKNQKEVQTKKKADALARADNTVTSSTSSDDTSHGIRIIHMKNSQKGISSGKTLEETNADIGSMRRHSM